MNIWYEIGGSINTATRIVDERTPKLLMFSQELT